ncbi:hypothetical protein Tco_1351566, partial [Tanacetum coccineum]
EDKMEEIASRRAWIGNDGVSQDFYLAQLEGSDALLLQQTQSKIPHNRKAKNKVHFAPNADLHIQYSIYILRAFFLS